MFTPWRPRQPRPLELPFTGPLFRPSHANGPSPQCGTVQALKTAMHRAGFGTFSSSDTVYGEDLERALANFQRNFRIPATGQFGRGSSEALRRLLAVIPMTAMRSRRR